MVKRIQKVSKILKFKIKKANLSNTKSHKLFTEDLPLQVFQVNTEHTKALFLIVGPSGKLENCKTQHNPPPCPSDVSSAGEMVKSTAWRLDSHQPHGSILLWPPWAPSMQWSIDASKTLTHRK